MDSWRYCCGYCGSHTLRKRVEKGGYHCRGCDRTIEKRHDKKLDGPVASAAGSA